MDTKLVGLDQADLGTVKSMAQVVENPVDNITSRLLLVEQQIQELEQELEDLLPIEADRKRQIQRKLHNGELPEPVEIDDDIENWLDLLFSMEPQPPTLEPPKPPEKQGLYDQRKALQGQLAFWEAGYYTWIPLDPLLWRDPETKLPTFALFSLEHNTVNFVNSWRNSSGRVEHQTEFLPKLPTQLEYLYADIFAIMQEPAYQIDTGRIWEQSRHIRPDERRELGLPEGSAFVRLSAKFTGTIPAETRTKIRQAVNSKVFTATDNRKACVYLLTEVQGWTLRIPAPINIDPIVVGWTAVHPDRLWYIDAFDITPLENQIPLSDQ